MTGTTGQYSILVPTYNRSPFLKRLFRYYAALKLKAPIHVADGSAPESLEANRALVRQFRDEGLDIRHFVPRANSYIEQAGSCRFGYVPRLHLALSEVETPYVHMLCDDCFTSTEFLETAASLLASDPATSTVVGQMWMVKLDRARRRTDLYGAIEELQLGGSRSAKDASTAAGRLLANAADNQLNAQWSMHRREDLAIFFSTGRDATLQVCEERAGFPPPGAAEEWGLDYLHGMMVNVIALVQGKVRYIPHLMLAHQLHSDNWGLQLSRGPRLNEAIMRPYWAFICEPYVGTLARLLAAQDGLTLEDARTVIQGYLWTDMGRRIQYIADLRLKSTLNGGVVTASSRRFTRHLDGIPALAPAMTGLRRAVTALRAHRTRRQDRRNAEIPEISFLHRFIEAGEP